jgi:hypothetical protein
MSTAPADRTSNSSGCCDRNAVERPFLSRLSVHPARVVCLGILLVNGAVVLWLMLLGRNFVPETVALQWWSGSTLPADNSQHLIDFYSLLHAVSGAALYFAARAVCPAWPVHLRFVMVITCSGIWEIIENTPSVIALFNDPHSPAVYRGDSVVNALCDTSFAAAGFLAAHVLPGWFIIAAGALVEIGVAWMIQDGFVLGTARLVMR